ncbi:MAG TPA: homoserine kinase [Candidatus Thermoplasmatota archaeon]|nr:homoserine kinase [Candidatus Thermoplasmatota archaeon]
MQASADAPCTVGNFGPGFDVLSMALAKRGDTVSVQTAEADSVSVRGAGSDRVPTEWAKNSACASIDELRRRTGMRTPLAVMIEKSVPPGSGLGSSASSNAAAVRAFAKCFRVTLTMRDALYAAGAGEAVATGTAHLDDVAAALFGGLTIVGGDTDPVVRMRPPPFHLVVVRPEVDLPTREMRKLIPDSFPRRDVVQNVSNVARIIAACHHQDGAMLCRALEDNFSRPYRAPKVPLWNEARQAALDTGALGFILSGSGPAMIAAVPERKDPIAVQLKLREVFAKGNVQAEIFVTRPGPTIDSPEIKL